MTCIDGELVDKRREVSGRGSVDDCVDDCVGVDVLMTVLMC
jgi:hypothetical protein